MKTLIRVNKNQLRETESTQTGNKEKKWLRRFYFNVGN